MQNSNKSPWWPVKLFGRHLLSGSAIFLILAAVQIALALLVHFALAMLHIPIFTARSLELAERVLVIVDIALFFLYLSWMAWRAIKEMIE